jgi:hypothetical protein
LDVDQFGCGLSWLLARAAHALLGDRDDAVAE